MTQPTPCLCTACGEAFSERRAALGYTTCLDCGDNEARNERRSWCIAPIAHKQAATIVTRRADLLGLNKTVQT